MCGTRYVIIDILARSFTRVNSLHLQPIRLSHRKAVCASKETQRRLSFIVRKIGEQGASISVYVEQVLREHLDQYKEEVERWRNSELLHSSNASLYCVTAFSECSNTAGGLSTSFLILARCVFVPQIAICTTKALTPKGDKITPKL